MYPPASAAVISILCFVGLTQAYTKFETECSVPNATNFVSSPNSRGTLNILWSCLFMIIACTWSIQQLNVSEQREERDPGWRGDLRWTLKGTWRTIKWRLATVIAPEIILGKAWGDLADAKAALKELQKFAEEDGVPWTLTHSLLANMGGFVIRFNMNRLDRQDQYTSENPVNPDLQRISYHGSPQRLWIQWKYH
jgi:hypothetical protein